MNEFSKLTKDDSENESKTRIDEALEIAYSFAQIDGEHHKTWVIDQIVRKLTGSDYEQWITMYEAEENGEKEYEWDTGIAP